MKRTGAGKMDTGKTGMGKTGMGKAGARKANMRKAAGLAAVVLLMSLWAVGCGGQAGAPVETTAAQEAGASAGEQRAAEGKEQAATEPEAAGGEQATGEELATEEKPAAEAKETADASGREAETESPAASAFDVLPEGQPDAESDFGVDQNVNMDTIDQYLGLSDVVYRDMRMMADPFDYEAIGGNSILTGTIEGFSVVPYPYLAPALNMPPEVGDGYDGPMLFTVDAEGTYRPCYEESLAILEAIFPKDQVVILMCGAGGYAGMTKNLLVSLGWDEALIYNAGGYWFYQGTHNVPLASEEGAAGLYHFTGLDLYEFDFTALTPVG